MPEPPQREHSPSTSTSLEPAQARHKTSAEMPARTREGQSSRQLGKSLLCINFLSWKLRGDRPIRGQH